MVTTPFTYTDIYGDDVMVEIVPRDEAIRIEIETQAYTSRGVRFISAETARFMAARLNALADELDHMDD